jgi:prephenate dehydratase
MTLMRVAIQGEKGSFHEAAADKWFEDNIEIIPSTTFADVFESLNKQKADAAIVAVENSIYGSINEVYNLIAQYNYPIVGEAYLNIHQQLIGLPNSTPEGIKQIYSHPVALAQCREYLTSNFPQAKLIEYYDTAASVAYVKDTGDASIAAVGSATSAKLHDLPVVATNIEDHPKNFTRFLVLQPDTLPPSDANRSSLVMTVKHEPGALAQALARFATAGINLAKLQSQPIVGKPLEYKFFLVIEASGPLLESVIEKIRSDGNDVRILGQYVSATETVLRN